MAAQEKDLQEALAELEEEEQLGKDAPPQEAPAAEPEAPSAGPPPDGAAAPSPATAAAAGDTLLAVCTVEQLCQKLNTLRQRWPEPHWPELKSIFEPILDVAKKHPAAADGAVQWAAMITEWLLEASSDTSGSGSFQISEVNAAL